MKVVEEVVGAGERAMGKWLSDLRREKRLARIEHGEPGDLQNDGEEKSLAEVAMERSGLDKRFIAYANR